MLKRRKGVMDSSDDPYQILGLDSSATGAHLMTADIGANSFDLTWNE